MSDVDELVAWLTGVLDQREKAARNCATKPDGELEWKTTRSALYGGHQVTVRSTLANRPMARIESVPGDQHEYWLTDATDVGRHIALNDPRQVIADVAFQRSVIDWCSQRLGWADDGAGWATLMLHGLAQAYAHWPGYRSEWRPM